MGMAHARRATVGSGMPVGGFSLVAAALAVAAALVLMPCRTHAAAQYPTMLQTTRLDNHTLYVEMHVKNGLASPDCYERQVLLVNGMFQPGLEVYVNDTVLINVFNELNPAFPQVASGISMHWHGFYMWGDAAWYDGASYVTQCPIVQGTNFTYQFRVDEAPGTYLWHDHATANRANGLQGPLIVTQPDKNIYGPYDKTVAATYTLFMSDWFHEEGNVMAMRLNRPVMQGKVNNDTGLYVGVGSPDSLLMNGKGYYADCNMLDSGVVGDNGDIVPVCEPTRAPMYSPMPATGAPIDGCGHQQFRVKPGEDYRLRLINAASASYVTVCIEGHSLTIIDADGLPTEEVDFDCIDLNNGQRYDAILSASKRADYAGRNFWITVSSQHRPMAPSTYAVLSYEGAPQYEWPLTPAPQPGILPWAWDGATSYIRTNEGVLGYLDNYEYEFYYRQFSHTGGTSYFAGILFGAADQKIVLNITQPVVTASGMIRWAMNNVAMPTDPPCEALMQLITNDPNWIANNTIDSTSVSAILTANEVAAARGSSIEAAQHRTTAVYVNGRPAPMIPLVGAQVATILKDEVVEIVLNNRPASEGNADSPVSSSSTQQHPMHLHGHKFWLLGIGEGVYNATLNEPSLNKYNPMLRDTMTLPVGSWAVLRFRADNPGVWPFHCHNMWHAFMGQQMYIIEGAGHWPPRPDGFPTCSKKCINNFAPFTNSWFDRTFSKRYEHV
ncbi:hypothetical protein FOA52_014218 [Chlamydomonas sp. UWO 241]|nr:hypothetical protein FOA52_014218 [Chlamydomonas sp. UWO 241]